MSRRIQPLAHSRVHRAHLDYHACVPGQCRDSIETEVPCGIGMCLNRRSSVHG